MGGAILPGIRLSVEALSKNTARLPSVEIIKPRQAVGRTTIESIQSGVFYGALGAARELINRMKSEVFQNEPVVVLATGGFSGLFEKHQLYDYLLSDLVLHGLRLAHDMNHEHH
jgi:type III pantothenate kinase